MPASGGQERSKRPKLTQDSDYKRLLPTFPDLRFHIRSIVAPKAENTWPNDHKEYVFNPKSHAFETYSDKTNQVVEEPEWVLPTRETLTIYVDRSTGYASCAHSGQNAMCRVLGR